MWHRFPPKMMETDLNCWSWVLHLLWDLKFKMLRTPPMLLSRLPSLKMDSTSPLVMWGIVSVYSNLESIKMMRANMRKLGSLMERISPPSLHRGTVFIHPQEVSRLVGIARFFSFCFHFHQVWFHAYNLAFLNVSFQFSCAIFCPLSRSSFQIILWLI